MLCKRSWSVAAVWDLWEAALAWDVPESLFASTSSLSEPAFGPAVTSGLCDTPSPSWSLFRSWSKSSSSSSWKKPSSLPPRKSCGLKPFGPAAVSMGASKKDQSTSLVAVEDDAGCSAVDDAAGWSAAGTSPGLPKFWAIPVIQTCCTLICSNLQSAICHLAAGFKANNLTKNSLWLHNPELPKSPPGGTRCTASLWGVCKPAEVEWANHASACVSNGLPFSATASIGVKKSLCGLFVPCRKPGLVHFWLAGSIITRTNRRRMAIVGNSSNYVSLSVNVLSVSLV